MELLWAVPRTGCCCCEKSDGCDQCVTVSVAIPERGLSLPKAFLRSET